MSTRGRVGLVLLAVAVGAVAGAAVLARGGGGGGPPLDRRAPSIAVRTSLTPALQLVGDPLVAELEVRVDRRRVDPASVRVEARWAPLELVGEDRLEQRGADAVRIRFRYRLQCFSPECVPPETVRALGLPTAGIVYRLVDEPRRATTVAEWPVVYLASRLPAGDAETARWRADARTPPAVTYRVTPGLLAVLLAAAALVAIVAAGVLAAGALRPAHRAEAAHEAAPAVPPVERALERVEGAWANGSSADGRRALERLARELEPLGHRELARRSRTLAWRAERPPREAVEQLADDVRRALERQP